MGESFTQQPDGRMVAGPALPDWSKRRGQTGFAKWLVPLVAVALLGLGYILGGGFAPKPTWQALYEARIVDGCLPLALIVGVGPQADADRLTSGLNQAAGNVRSTIADAHDIETHLIPTRGLRVKNPQAELVGFLTLERCL